MTYRRKTAFENAQLHTMLSKVLNPPNEDGHVSYKDDWSDAAVAEVVLPDFNGGGAQAVNRYRQANFGLLRASRDRPLQVIEAIVEPANDEEFASPERVLNMAVMDGLLTLAQELGQSEKIAARFRLYGWEGDLMRFADWAEQRGIAPFAEAA